MNKKSVRNFFAYLNAGVFFCILSWFGINFFFISNNEISVQEKRKLCPLPVFSVDGFTEGTYTDSLDIYFADNFPYRDFFVEVSFNMKDTRGLHSEEVAFYKIDKPQKKEKPKVLKASVKADSSKPDSTKLLVEDIEPDTAAAEVTETEGLLIYNGKAIQMFGGNKAMAEYFASVMNKYQEKLDTLANIYCVIVPTHGEFCLPSEYKKHYSSEKNNIDLIYAALNEKINKVDAYSNLQKHKSEYVYFNTDHHWTGLGAYYAYESLCTSAKIQPVKLESMQRKVKKKFLGSLYWLSRDSKLKENIDSVEYFKVSSKHTSYICNNSNGKDSLSAGKLYVEYASGPNSYGVFLGGDFPLMRVDTDNKIGRKILVIKNSYGNPFATYMAGNFDQVYVLDYRYYHKSVTKLIKDKGITDVVFVSPTFSVNTKWHVDRLKKIL